MPVRGACSYCLTQRAVNLDHVIPLSARRRLESCWKSVPRAKQNAVYFGPDGKIVSDSLMALAPSCFECNMRKGTRLLIPPSWSDRLDELNALGIGTFRVWHGDVESLRSVVK